MKEKTSVARTILTMKQKQYITPHFIRVILTGDDLDLFADAVVGVNNKIFIPPSGVKDVHFPASNDQANQPLEKDRAIIRTYTHRGIDLEKKELTIDFVNHGETGPASSWALNASIGDPLGVAMKIGKTELYPPADWYLLVGDATAIPVLSAIMESLPSHAKGIAIIEVHGKEDEQALFTKADIAVRWLHNPHPEKGSELANAVKQVPISKKEESTCFGYIAAEFSSVKDIRQYLRKDKLWTKEELYAYSYWKAGVAEDQSVIDRRKEKESI